MLLFKKDKNHPTRRAVCKHSASFGAQLSTVDPRMRPDPKSPKATGQMGSWGWFLEVLQDRLLQVYLPMAEQRESSIRSRTSWLPPGWWGDGVEYLLLGQVCSGGGRAAGEVPCSSRETTSLLWL